MLDDALFWYAVFASIALPFCAVYIGLDLRRRIIARRWRKVAMETRQWWGRR